MVCVSLSLLTAFSVTANAEELKNYEIRQDVYIYWRSASETIAYENFLNFTPNNGTKEVFEERYNEKGANLNNRNYKHRTVWNIFAPSEGYPFKINKENRVTLENFYYRYLMIGPWGDTRYVSDYDDLYCLVTYVDNSTERIEVNSTLDSDMSLDMNFTFRPSQNVQRFDIYVESIIKEHLTDDEKSTPYEVTITSYYGETKGDNKYNFNIEIQSEEATLLSGILGWIQNIWNKMTDTFDKLTEIGSYIAELPSKLWNLISEGLQYLFIPTEEAITEFKSKMDTLLENKLGAVYQVSNTVIEAWDRIQESEETDTIEFPSTTIKLPGGNEFTFGGYDVKIVPDGFTIVVTALKSIVGIVCTIAFVNGLRKRYDEVMGVV